MRRALAFVDAEALLSACEEIGHDQQRNEDEHRAKVCLLEVFAVDLRADIEFAKGHCPEQWALRIDRWSKARLLDVGQGVSINGTAFIR
jgi:hypothetical protein